MAAGWASQGRDVGCGAWSRHGLTRCYLRRAETTAQRAEVLKDFSRSSSSASSFASVVEETEGGDADDTGLVRGPGSRGGRQPSGP